MNGLSELAIKYRCDKGEARIDGHESHKYTQIYFEIFNPIKGEVKNVLEIGVEKGSSLRMWRDFFPNALVYGIDSKEKCLFQGDKIKSFLGSQEKPVTIRNQIDKLKCKFDIIIDDGSHIHEHQQKTLAAIFKFLKSGGLYIIEDLHCAFYPEYGLSETTLDFLQRFVDKEIIKSRFFTRQQIGVLRRMVGDCKIHRFPRAHNKGGQSIVGILTRK